jgi:hypothetical protein
VGIGGGLLQTSSAFEGNVGALPASEAIGTITYSGAAIALDLVIGGALVPGFVLAYGYAGQIVGEPNVSVEDSAGGDYEQSVTESLGLSIHGLAVDIFPNPTQNLELGGLFGLASVGTGPQDTSSLGWGAALWGGYGLWANRNISMGALLRLSYARTTGDDYVPVTTSVPNARASNIDRSDETLTIALLGEFLLN